MAKATQTPSSVLVSLMNEYQVNSFSLSREISLSYSTVRLIVAGKSKVTAPTALRLAKYFGQTPEYWLDLQRTAELSEAQKDKKLVAVIKNIQKAKKPTNKPKTQAKAKPVKKTAKAAKPKTNTRGKKAKK